MLVNVKCHYQKDDQIHVETLNKLGKKNPHIYLSLTDTKSRRKLREVIKKYIDLQIKDHDDLDDSEKLKYKTPIYSRMIKVATDSKTKYYKGDDRVLLSKLIGHEVTAKIKLKKYSFKSMITNAEVRKGDVVNGIKATLIELRSEF